mmetsp:Transcript_22582/g.66529  ORF Transcript_22582/g.66529 Transcript_22582/m.66529 type:complete len:217 (-) Transcript_22582:268-918(-)
MAALPTRALHLAEERAKERPVRRVAPPQPRRALRAAAAHLRVKGGLARMQRLVDALPCELVLAGVRAVVGQPDEAVRVVRASGQHALQCCGVARRRRHLHLDLQLPVRARMHKHKAHRRVGAYTGGGAAPLRRLVGVDLHVDPSSERRPVVLPARQQRRARVAAAPAASAAPLRLAAPSGGGEQAHRVFAKAGSELVRAVEVPRLEQPERGDVWHA